MSVYHKADPGELIQWVTHESRSSAASNSGLIKIGTQPRTADAWHHDSCWPRGVVTRDFPAIFDRLFDRLPVRISTSDLHHWILRKKIFHIRAYDFGVQFSFNFHLGFINMVTLRMSLEIYFITQWSAQCWNFNKQWANSFHSKLKCSVHLIQWWAHFCLGYSFVHGHVKHFQIPTKKHHRQLMMATALY